MNSINECIANELGVSQKQVNAAVQLLDEGSTVPFISRYRKEVTGGLDDTQMRNLEERLRYLRELEARRQTVIKSIEEQGKLTPELSQAIQQADSKSRLEDLYLPYKPKRRTKAQIAREAGLEPLAQRLFDDPNQEPVALAQQYVDEEKGVSDSKAALDGAKQILMERFSEDADLLSQLRQFLSQEGILSARLIAGQEQEGAKFRDYFEHDEPIGKVPSHRALAMFRGRNEGVLSIALDVAVKEEKQTAHPCESMLADFWDISDLGRAADKWLQEVLRWTWRVKLQSHLEADLLSQLREGAERDAINVFAHNLKDLLLAAPAGQKVTIGLDPGLRTGVKVAVIDATGKFLDHDTIYPTAPQNRTQEAAAKLLLLAGKYDVELIAIGNGTASRETDRFVGEFMAAQPEYRLKKVMVNEAGASVYSASEFAAKEFPDLDVTIRGAVSIARRLQDPLAELVKIEPKSIGVGQYQHDVGQTALARQLNAVVEDCVNAVGVDINTASAPLLSRVAGLNQTLANNIVEFRDTNGVFKNRKQLKKIPRLGEKTFEQAAAFLRITEGENPLDASAVHPESYVIVKKIAERNERDVKSMIGDSRFLRSLKPDEFTDEKFGVPTVIDIIQELDKPGRDPRPEFKTAGFKEGVETLKDLQPGLLLEGCVTNVTNFGAFVDIGVHQDGLVHISALAKRFVKDPRDIVKAGDIVQVKVMEVDIARKRIALTMRLDDPMPQENGAKKEGRSQPSKAEPGRKNAQTNSQKNTAQQPTGFAQAFQQARKKKDDRL